MALTVTIPYEDYKTLVQDASDKVNVISILKTEFPDDTCQLVAIKSILGVKEEKDEPITDDTEPSEPSTDDTEESDINGTE